MRAIFVCCLLMSALVLQGCDSGFKDGLLFTGITKAPDEFLIKKERPLEIPNSIRLVPPGSETTASVTRTHGYQVNEILFGEQAAQQHAQTTTQALHTQQLSVTERQLLQISGADAQGNVKFKDPRDNLSWWQRVMRVPRLLDVLQN